MCTKRKRKVYTLEMICVHLGNERCTDWKRNVYISEIEYVYIVELKLYKVYKKLCEINMYVYFKYIA